MKYLDSNIRSFLEPANGGGGAGSTSVDTLWREEDSFRTGTSRRPAGRHGAHSRGPRPFHKGPNAPRTHRHPRPREGPSSHQTTRCSCQLRTYGLCVRFTSEHPAPIRFFLCGWPPGANRNSTLMTQNSKHRRSTRPAAFKVSTCALYPSWLLTRMCSHVSHMRAHNASCVCSHSHMHVHTHYARLCSYSYTYLFTHASRVCSHITHMFVC